MRFLHTSDWHLGAAEATISLAEDQVFFIEEICRIIKEQNIDAVLLAGDVYDRAMPSGEAIKLYDDAMTKICLDLDTDVITIAGNHDSAERISSCNKLLKKAGLYVCGAIQEEPEIIEYPDVEVFLLPWITAEKVRSIYPAEKENIKTIEDAYKVVTDHMKSKFTAEKKHILLSHSFITNSETSTSDRAAEIGFATQVPASVFDGFDYVALGHIHKPQNVNERIRYSGTPMPFSFGKEEKQEKSVTIIDTKDMSQTIIPLSLLHQRRTFSGPLEEMLNPTCSEEEKNGYIRVEVTDNYVGLSTLNDLRNVYQNLIEVTGKSFESSESSVTLSIEELEKIKDDPIEVFKQFYRDEMSDEASDHFVELFKKAIEETNI